MTALRFTLSASLLLSFCLPISGQELHHLRPYEQKPGEVLIIRTTSQSSNGAMTVTDGDNEQKGTVEMKRERVLERRVPVGEAGRQVLYRIDRDLTTTTITFEGKGRPQTAASPLTGQAITGIRDTVGRWRFTIPGREPSPAEALELVQFAAYENHRLLPEKPVRIRESWEVDPSFLTHLTERGVGLAEVKARARLDSIKTIEGERTAIITLNIQTVATEGTAADGRGSGASITATGELHIAMDTMLDKKLILLGALTKINVEGSRRSHTHLPVRIEVTKTLLR